METVPSFYFYDLETTGVDSRRGRIMQFAGQRTDMDLNPIGDPHNVLIKITDDILPEPDAIMITGITPQKTLAEGITEAEFAKLFQKEIVRPGTIFTGFNSIRFDDEFMRFFLFRNFYDPYEWQWKDGCSRWDLLDVSRMTRALRPDGMQWPFDSAGKPSNRLELLAATNKLTHDNAHDALSDVTATIELAKCIRASQPKLFDYLLTMRSKNEVKKLVNYSELFVYSSGKYALEHEKTTVVTSLGPHPDKQGALVYDLRFDPTPFLKLSPEQLADKWRWKKDRTDDPLPVKSLQFNRCPAVAPIGVVDEDTQDRLQLDMIKIKNNLKTLLADKGFVLRLHQALTILNTGRVQTNMIVDELNVDGSLYDGFLPDQDRRLIPDLHKADPADLTTFIDKFQDQRLKTLVPLFKARNYPNALDDEERIAWEDYRARSLQNGGENSPLARFGKRLLALRGQEGLSGEKQYLLEELELYAQSILPATD